MINSSDDKSFVKLVYPPLQLIDVSFLAKFFPAIIKRLCYDLASCWSYEALQMWPFLRKDCTARPTEYS